MVDIMATTSEDFKKENEDFEDGELPEDGEICDDEDPQGKGDNTKTETTHRSVSNTNHPSTTDNASPRKHALPPSRPKDLDAPTDGGSGQSGGEDDFFGYGGEDKDYRMNDEDYGDYDYRQEGPSTKRRRPSPPQEEFERGGRGRGGYAGRNWRPYRSRPRWATEHQICKFFREGYCRDEDNCSYSHQAEDSLRRPELCKFYQQGFCKKGLTCLMLHGEFPCKAFHKGECSRNPCQYSHQPLTDYTRPMFERMQQHDEDVASYVNPHTHSSASAANVPAGGPPRLPRRVLLPQGPQQLQQPQQQPAAPIIHANLPPQHINGQLPPPSIVVPTLQTPSQQQQTTFNLPRPVSYFSAGSATSQSPRIPDDQPMSAAPPMAAINISQMLAQLAGESTRNNTNTATIDESPASPPRQSFIPTPIEPAKSIPQNSQPVWRLYIVEASAPYANVTAPPTASSADPRMSKVISSQFDAVSTLIANTPQQPASESVPPRDPRAVVVTRDPRKRPEERKSTDGPRPSWMPQMA